MVLPLFVSIEKIDRSLLEASKDLGAGKWTTFRRVTLPLSMPGIIAGCMLVAIPTTGEFVIPAILGGDKVVHLGLAHLQGVHRPAVTGPLGSALSNMLLVVMMIVVALYVKLRGHGGVLMAETTQLADAATHGTAPRQGPSSRAGTAHALQRHRHRRLGDPHVHLPVLADRRARHLLVQRPEAERELDAFHASSGTASIFDDSKSGAPRPDVINAFVTSIEIAILSTIIAVVIGTLGSFALERFEFRTKTVWDGLNYTKIIIAEVVAGVSTLLFFVQLDNFLDDVPRVQFRRASSPRASTRC